MPKYSDRPCAHCGKMMLHAYFSQRYCKACAPLVRSDDAIISRAKQRSKRAISEIARVNALARAEGKTYSRYVALHEPRKG
jgi:ribosomal protein L20